MTESANIVIKQTGYFRHGSTRLLGATRHQETPAAVGGVISLTTVSLTAIVLVTSPGAGMRVNGAKWQATQWSRLVLLTLRHSGTCCLQMSWASQQRVWKRQPVGGFSGLGTSPFSTMRWRRLRGSGMGMADSSAWV